MSGPKSEEFMNSLEKSPNPNHSPSNPNPQIFEDDDEFEDEEDYELDDYDDFLMNQPFDNDDGYFEENEDDEEDYQEFMREQQVNDQYPIKSPFAAKFKSKSAFGLPENIDKAFYKKTKCELFVTVKYDDCAPNP